ncbi:transcription factor bHLH148-like [Primulina huaijiensis]|uniref:transcription factor bHLH148-like n=1 Tax=Primulina huaijiensis TaxID=1492673 RepID=UPI003CC737C0
MSSSLLSPNPAVNSDRSLARRKKKKKIQSSAVGENLRDDFQQQNAPVQWKSDAQHQIYTSKLLQALRQVRQNNNGSSPQKSASRRVHEAADRVLAATAKGRSRWSRAMLMSRLKLKFMKKNNITKRQQSVMTAITTGNSSRPLKKSKVSILRLKSKSLPEVQRKTSILGRLVPGCRKQPLQVVLEEANDYIPALEMQVRVMRALAELLSVSGSSSSSSSSNDSISGAGTAGGLTQFRTSRPPTN